MPNQPCSAMSRRGLLHAGSIGLAGLNWPLLMKAQAAPLAGGPGFGRAKRCLLLFMWGGPSHIDTFDPKPLAPENVRGSFQTIATQTPGLFLSEHFRGLAQRTQQISLVRSVTHDDPAHLSSVHSLLTGHLPPVNKSDAEPPSDRDTPCIGSVISHLKPSVGALPAAVSMPWIVSHPAAPGGKAPGQHAGWLGHQYDPFLVSGDPNLPDWKVPALTLVHGQSLDRLQHRRELLRTLETASRASAQAPPAAQLAQQQSQAFGLLTSAAVQGAFNLQQESAETRERYGRNIHGQCVLLARRLLDHGVPLVTVNWHDDHQNFWDTHGNNFARLKDALIPPADRALCALLDDLQQSGQLDETLIVWVGEFGRQPKINDSAGRDHFPGCYTALFAGAGTGGGQIFGGSDAIGSEPTSDPVSPLDLTATMYHALGISPETLLYDAFQRPHPLTRGRAIQELFQG